PRVRVVVKRARRAAAPATQAGPASAPPPPPVGEGGALAARLVTDLLGTLARDGASVVVLEPRLGVIQIIGLARTRAEEVGRLGNLRVLVEPLVPRCRLRRAVDVAVAEPEEPGLALVAVGPLDVLDGPLRVVVGRVAVLPPLLAVEREQLPFVVGRAVLGVFRPVPADLVVPVASEAGVGPGVPLADLGGVVAALAEEGRPEGALLRVVGAGGVGAVHPHRLDGVRLVAGEHGRPRRHAPRTRGRPVAAAPGPG